MKPSKYTFKHNYKLVRGHNRSSRVTDFRFNIEIAKMRFASIAGRIPKNIREDIESRVIRFYQDYPSSKTSPNSVYAYLVYWYQISAKLDLDRRLIARVFDMKPSTLSGNYRHYARQTKLFKNDDLISAQLLEV